MFEEIDFFFLVLKETISSLRDFCVNRDVLDLRSTGDTTHWIPCASLCRYVLWIIFDPISRFLSLKS